MSNVDFTFKNYLHDSDKPWIIDCCKTVVFSKANLKIWLKVTYAKL